MTWFAVGSSVISAAGTAYSAYSASQNKPPTIDISKVIQDAQTQASNSLQQSINLENQYLPGQAANRAAAQNLNQNIASGNTQSQTLQALLLGSGSGVTNASTSAYLNNPLTTAANSSILQTLNQAQAGQLPAGVQAQAMQSALQQGGAAGISGSGAGRGLTARDLGLTQLQYLTNAQNQASTAGNAYGALGLQQQGLQLQNYLGTLGLVNNAVGQQNQFGLGFGTLMNQTAMPNSGLSGSQVASLDVGNTNILGQNALQSQANTAAATSGIAGLFTGSNMSGLASGLSGLFGGGGGATGSTAAMTTAMDDTGAYASVLCWVAREAFGVHNPRWKQFRHWVLNKSSVAFKAFYLSQGPALAALLSGRPAEKPAIRAWMQDKIDSMPFIETALA